MIKTYPSTLYSGDVYTVAACWNHYIIIIIMLYVSMYL